MTDNEIIKALECRSLTGLRKINKCGKCKYVKSDACNIRGLITDALDLINRQNEQLKANFDSRQTNELKNIDVARFEAEINLLQAENERLQKNLEEAHLDIKEQRAGIEVLEEENKLLIARNCELAEKGEKAITTFVKSQKRTKAEAYKEFAERLQEKVIVLLDTPTKENIIGAKYLIDKVAFDNLQKTRELEKYNKEHKTRLSYGQYVGLVDK